MAVGKPNAHKCSRCGRFTTLSPAIGLCEVCLYHDEVGADAAARQVHAAEKAAQRRLAIPKAARR